MLNLPNQRFDPDDLHRLADWVELSCLVTPASEVSVGDIAEHLHSSLLLEEPDGDETPKDRARMRAEEIVAVIRKRQRLGGGYPFVVAGDIVASRGTWATHLCFTALLAADLGRFYRGTTALTGKQQFTLLFEKISQCCLASMFQSKAVRFGWPIEAGWPTPIADRVRQLARELEYEADSPESKTSSSDKDIGLDVAVRMSILGDEPGTGVLLAQCATGENWQTKTDEPYLKVWSTLLRWDAHLIQAAVFPWRYDHPTKVRHLCRKFPGFVFDRLRLARAPSPDAALEPDVSRKISRWCDERIAEISASA